MSDVALEAAQARLAERSAELADIQSQIETLTARAAAVTQDCGRLNDFIRTWYEMAGIAAPPTVTPIVSESEKSPVKRVRPENPDRREVARKCVTYIREAQHPLMRHQLFQRLGDDGIFIKGKDPEMVLSTMLWRSKDTIIRLKGGGYWPAADPLPSGHAKSLI